MTSWRNGSSGDHDRTSLSESRVGWLVATVARATVTPSALHHRPRRRRGQSAATVTSTSPGPGSGVKTPACRRTAPGRSRARRSARCRTARCTRSRPAPASTCRGCCVGVRDVPHAYDDGERLPVECTGDVQGEGEVAASVAADVVAVHPDVAVLVDGAEVQQQPVAQEPVGDGDGAVVPEQFVGLERPPDPGQPPRENRTMIGPSQCSGSLLSSEVNAWSQVPLRLSHPSRTSCGRGCSGRTCSGSSPSPHGVVRLTPAPPRCRGPDAGRAPAPPPAARRPPRPGRSTASGPA